MIVLELKRCVDCGRDKPYSDFQRSGRAKAGYTSRCKPCIAAKRNPKRSLDRERERDRARRRNPKWRSTNRARERRLWRDQDPRILARRKLTDAVRRKKIVKPSSCQDCSAEGPVQGHHEDYSRPLDVKWVCRDCHRKRHQGATP